jgi:hypothetical protein
LQKSDGSRDFFATPPGAILSLLPSRFSRNLSRVSADVPGSSTFRQYAPFLNTINFPDFCAIGFYVFQIHNLACLFDDEDFGQLLT